MPRLQAQVGPPECVPRKGEALPAPTRRATIPGMSITSPTTDALEARCEAIVRDGRGDTAHDGAHVVRVVATAKRLARWASTMLASCSTSR